MNTQATIYGVISTLEKYSVEDAKRILFQMVQEMEHRKPPERSESTEGIEPVAWMSDRGKVVSASGKLRMEEAEHPAGIHYDIPLFAHPPKDQHKPHCARSLMAEPFCYGVEECGDCTCAQPSAPMVEKMIGVVMDVRDWCEGANTGIPKHQQREYFRLNLTTDLTKLLTNP